MEQIITLKNINKSFGQSRVLDNISVEFEKGLVHGIVGKNGSGKTVLAKLICGLLHPDSGEVIVAGKRIGVDVDFPDRTGAIIDAPGFISYYSGYKNLEYLASIKSVIKKKDIMTAMQLVGLDPLDKKHVGKYSLGMKQRLSIAQAIMENPDLLILDEPMNGLDKDGVNEMRRLFSLLNLRGVSILFISHITEDIKALCNKTHFLNDGHLSIIEMSVE